MNNKILSSKELKVMRCVRNSLVHRGCTPSLRELRDLLGYRSHRSISIIVRQLIDKGYLRRGLDGALRLLKDIEESKEHARTINVPLVGVVACGTPILAEENFEGMIPVSTNLARPPHKYFLLRVDGNSMNEKNINDGDLVLVKQQSAADNGDNVVALIDDEATVKELKITDNAIILKPRSKNKEHKQIILDRDFHIQGVVVTAIPDL